MKLDKNAFIMTSNVSDLKSDTLIKCAEMMLKSFADNVDDKHVNSEYIIQIALGKILGE